jgi:hypothetical protein
MPICRPCSTRATQASISTTPRSLAGFQIALWETLDDKSLTSGSYQNWAGDTGSIEEDLALIVAETFLDNITLGAPGTGN